VPAFKNAYVLKVFFVRSLCSKLLDASLSEQEMALVADLGIETVDEAKKVVPSLEVGNAVSERLPTAFQIPFPGICISFGQLNAPATNTFTMLPMCLCAGEVYRR
jgi:hypothetical protein